MVYEHLDSRLAPTSYRNCIPRGNLEYRHSHQLGERNLNVYPIHPVPKPYAWGSYDRLQTMFSSCLPQESVGPLAEMWFSGHGQWPSVVDMTGTNGVPVTDVIRNDPEHMVGSRSSEQF
jgi:mannose-6-phosphate isomerase